MAGIDVTKFAHSPVHSAIATRDYAGLRKILGALPRLCNPTEIRSEAASHAEEEKADAISAVIDRRDVLNRDTPLHLAVKLRDETATEMLMVAGADWSLQNEQGWSALQEAICNREENIAMIIVRHYQPLAWAKWCRRLPRLIATMRRMRDFYMEITFHFESSVIPFISRIAPSDTYKIWKRGANLRADMTLAGFDGFRIQRADQSILFLGDGSEDGRIPPGSLCMVSHKDKEVMNALDGAGSPATEEEVRQEVAAMSQTNIFRPGIDVTQAVLLPQLTWRRQERTEMVGLWKAKVYDMHNVVVSIKSRRVPGAMTDDEFFSSCNENETEGEELDEILTDEERKQLEAALLDSAEENGDARENEYKKGLRPILWLSPNFPLQTEELLPLLDILANKVKAIRRLRELLTTKLPMGTFPVKVAIPVVPTIRVLATFTKFEELHPLDEFSTPPSSPTGRESPAVAPQSSSSSWFQWIKAPYNGRTSSSLGCSSSQIDNIQDPFVIPSDYTWVTAEAKKKKMQDKNKSKKR
ncbi:hypothetical protein CRG98_035503 [Punica granatum]|uniref:Ankyrin repeat domain-containing protein n=1 Tax=Punica granatum TaxID=22663 RepID=A0A2I0IJA8_PUNGR|nr:hypothetical protein CRG98_035503 [Punica granatum]